MILSVLIFSLLSPPAYADKIFVEKASGAGSTQTELDTATDLIQSSVSARASDTLVEHSGEADFVLRPKLTRLGEAYILSLFRVKNGQVLNSSQLKATRIEELDKIAQRVTQAVLQSESAASPKVGSITQEETRQGTERRPARNNQSLSLGASHMADLNSSGIGYNLGWSYSWDVNTARVKALLEGNLGGGNGFLVSGGIGGNYYLTQNDIAPYVSADFGVGVAKTHSTGILSGETIAGFVVGAGAGIELLRTSSINMDIGFRFGWLLNSTSFGMPKVYSLHVGIYF